MTRITTTSILKSPRPICTPSLWSLLTGLLLTTHVATVGCGGPNPAVPDSAEGMPQPNGSPLVSKADTAKKPTTNQLRVDEPEILTRTGPGLIKNPAVCVLVEAGWIEPAAVAVLDLNARWFQTLRDQDRARDVDLVVDSLQSLGSEDRVVDLLNDYPTLAGFFLMLDQERLIQLFRSIDSKSIPHIESVLARAVNFGRGESMLEILCNRDLRQVIIQLQIHGFPGAEAICFNLGDKHADGEYVDWISRLHQLLRPDRDHPKVFCYQVLKNLARGQMNKEPPVATLQPTALVHEAFLRLGNSAGWRSKSYFLAAAANSMRQILVDRARARVAAKRGGEYRKLAISNLDGILVEVSDRQLVELEDALHDLGEIDARKARIVEMKFFGGLTIPEMAEALDLSEATVKREWTFARALIRQYFENGELR